MEIDSTPSTRVSLKRSHDAHSDETPRKQNSINDHDVAAGEAREELGVLLRDLTKSRNAKRFLKGGRRISILKTDRERCSTKVETHAVSVRASPDVHPGGQVQVA
jgi:hypothetical protein